MTDRDALYRSILENPADNTVRRVYADFIREQGEDARADFIELQLQIAELDELGDQMFKLCQSAELLIPKSIFDWFPGLTRHPLGHWPIIWADRFTFGNSQIPVNFVLRRGFLSSVTVRTDFWFKQQPNDMRIYGFKEHGIVFNSHGARIVANHPIDRVNVRGVTPRGNPIPGGEVYPFSFYPSEVSREVWDLLYPNRFANLRAAHDKLSWVYLTLARREAGLPNLPWDSSNDLKD